MDLLGDTGKVSLTFQDDEGVLIEWVRSTDKDYRPEAQDVDEVEEEEAPPL